MGDRAAKDALFDGFAGVGRALGNGRRAEIVDLLVQAERSVEEIAGELGQSPSRTPRSTCSSCCGWAWSVPAATATGSTTRWPASASPSCGGSSGRWPRSMLEELDRLAAAYLGDRSRLDTMTRDELAERLRSGDVVVLDVRPEPEFRAGHIAGALSIPVAELSRRLHQVPKGQQIVAYCRGPYCVYADDAVRSLRHRGYPAARLEDGYPEWARAGLPVRS